MKKGSLKIMIQNIEEGDFEDNDFEEDGEEEVQDNDSEEENEEGGFNDNDWSLYFSFVNFIL